MTGTRDGALESSSQFLGMWKEVMKDLAITTKIQKGVTVIWAECNFAFFNALSFDDADVDQDQLKHRLLFASDLMRTSKHSGYFWLFEELLNEQTRMHLNSILKETNFEQSITCFGMAADLVEFSDPSHLDLQFERVSKPEHLIAYADLNAHGYGLPESQTREVLQNSILWCESIYAYHGYHEGHPVCCAGVFPLKDSLLVILVATEPTFGRRGYGGTIVRKAIYEGRKATGLHRAALQATQAGKSVYESIGFKVTSIVQLLRPKMSSKLHWFNLHTSNQFQMTFIARSSLYNIIEILT